MDSNDRPDPEELLSAIRLEEKKSSSGKLKIFLGMSAGVGKTYAMLKAAHQQMMEGRDLIVGSIDTHGRQETEKLLAGLPTIATKWVKYRDTVFEELDLETIINKKPSLVLVDELAHTNVPGSRHPKRWQDVLELLDSDIDVYTTVNVQHIESRKDLVESIAGISIRETVPDLILDRASEVELIDITPTDLLKRLHEGKVYTGDHSKVAAQNFFKEDRLTALREVALRLTAEKVDHDLDTMLTAQTWKPNERLMVAIDHHIDSQFLIRSARRLAANLNASWIAIYVDKGIPLDGKEQINLARNLDLARQLGAEAITTRDSSITTALKRVASQKKVTQIIIGRPSSSSWWHWGLKKHSLDRLIEECGEIDIHVIRHTIPGKKSKKTLWHFQPLKELNSYLLTAIVFSLITLAGVFLPSFINPASMGFLFLLGILAISPFTERGPILFAALLSSIFWGLLFLPSMESINELDFENSIFFILYFLSAIILGAFISRISQNEKLMRIREESTQTLYEITQEIASGRSTETIIESVLTKLGKLLHGFCALVIKGHEGGLSWDEHHPFMNEEKECAVALWAFEKDKPAGWSTDTLPSVKNLYIPLKGFQECIGVLAFQPEKDLPLSFEETNLLYTVCKQLAAYIERSITEEKTRKTEYLQQSSRVQRAIIDSIASELVTYLEMTRSAMREFKESALPSQFNEKAHNALSKIDGASATMDRVLQNILAMSDLNVGVLALQKTEHSLAELVQLSLNAFNDTSFINQVEIKISPSLSLGTFDLPLMQMLLSHLLEMFVIYVNKGFKIHIEGKEINRKLQLTLKTVGNINEASAQNFDKNPLSAEEIYLGTSVAKTIAEVHSGKLEIHQLETGGLEFIVFLPLPTSLIGRISKLTKKQNSIQIFP